MRLQTRFLAALVPVVALTLLAFGWVVYAQLRQDSEDELSRQMERALDRVEQHSLAYIDRTETNVDLFAGSALIEQYMTEREESRIEGPLRGPLLALFGKLRRTVPAYREIRLLRRNGHEELRLAEPGLVNRSVEEGGTPWFDDVGLHWAAAVHSTVVEHPDDGEISLLVTKPLKLSGTNAAGERTTPMLRGFLSVSTDLGSLERKIARQDIGGEGYLLLLDPEGEVLLGSEPAGREANTSAARLLEGYRELGKTGVVSVELDGRRSLVAKRRLPGSLGLLAIVPESELDAVGTHLAKSVAGVTAASIVLVSLLLLALVRVLVLRPLVRLRESAISIGEGQVDTVIDVRRDDEIGDLASAFRDMRAKLVDSMVELRSSHVRIEQLAFRDSLTGLPNRRSFVELVEREIDIARQRGEQLAILFLDLDDFKRLNDSEGHAAGDRLLREVAARLRRCVEGAVREFGSDRKKEGVDTDRVARFGGDEFVMLLTDVDGVIGASAMASSILGALAEPLVFETRERTIGTSIGIALYPDDASGVDALIAAADMAMYAAKQRRKNTWRFYDTSMRAEIDSRLLLESDLRRAIGSAELTLRYQPQFRLSDGALSGVEALLRWEHPKRGPIGPDRFIPVAEETGLIVALGEWVLEEACRQWSRWNAMGVAPERVAINVSQRQFALSDVAASVVSVLRRCDIDPTALELEVTESCIMEGAEAVIDTLEEIREMGVHLAMDDFGTGYSSLGALTTLPIDTLKIDRCFVSGVEAHSPNDKIVTAMLMLGTSLGLSVVAEGVETEIELEYLRKRGCDIVQGYHLGRPLPEVEMTARLLEEAARDTRKAG